MNVQENTKGRVAIVTGASSGIGLGIAKALLDNGWNVVGSARTKGRLDEAAATLGTERFVGVAGDIASPETAQQLIEQTIARFGKVELLVNNAGIFAAKPFVDFKPDEIERQIATNLKGVVYASQEAARRMIPRGQGQIINITASLAIQPRSQVSAFMAVLLKGGLNQATRALALELAPHGIRVNAIAPGIIDSPLHTPESHEFLKTQQPARRLGTIAEIAGAVLYLVDAGFTSGIVLPVDGAASAGNFS